MLGILKNVMKHSSGATVTGESDSLFGGRLFKELEELLKHTCPMFIAQFAVLTLPAVVIIICGHIGEEEMDGSTLGFALFCPLGLAIGYGLSSASSTLLSQTFGSGNYIQVGIVLQRSIYVLLLSVFPSCAILYNAEIILLFCKQDPTIARLGGVYCKISCFSLPSLFISFTLVAYLQSQSIIKPIVITHVAAAVCQAVTSYFLVLQFSLGFSGAVWSQVVTYWFLAGVLVIYIKVASIQEQTWGGWTVEGLYDWNEIVHLGIPGIIFTIMEWSCFDIPSLVAGLLGDDQLAVYSIIWQVLNISIMPCFSMARIVIVRVGNFLGKYEPSHARIAGRVALLINVISTIIIVIIVVCMRNILPLLFTSDKYIVQLTSSTLPVLVLLIPYSNAITQAAILQGIGHQRTVAIYSFIVYYLIGLPIGFFLIFVVKTGMVGYWIGIFLASVCQSLFYDIAITRIDWVQEAEKAHMRAYINIQGKYTTSLNTSDDDFAEDYIIENLNSKSNYHYDATYDGQNESTSLCMKENGSTKSFSTNERPVIKSIIMKRIAVLVCMIIVLIVGVLIESSMTSRVREFMKEELNVDFNATSIE